MANITTIHGDMDESLLAKKVTTTETADQTLVETEYYLEGTLVHRSVHIHIKKGLDLLSRIYSLE